MNPTRLYVTEKPSAARDLAAGICVALNVRVTNASTMRSDGYHLLSNGDVVASQRGHLVEPVFLNAEQKAADLSTYFSFLPVVVKHFDYVPKPDLDKDFKPRMKNGKPLPSPQYVILCDLLKRSKEIVNAGDIDREGQLIFDELCISLGIDPEGPDGSGRGKPIWRLPLVSNREDVIAAQVRAPLEKNGDRKWVLKRKAALARAHVDLGLGMNGSMAYQAATKYRRMSMGRVQTPVTNMVVELEERICRFTATNYFVPVITMADGTVMRFYKREGAQGQPGFDAEGRIIDESIAKRMCQLITSGMPGTVTAAESVNGAEAPPLPFSASILASTVAKRTGMTPKEVEAIAQKLYEKKAISYVGTDCTFLPLSLKEDARATLTALSRLYPQQAGGCSLEITSKAWNDAKVDEHHAIVPTGMLPTSATQEESQVFDAISRRYMAQFYPAYEFVTHRLAAVFGHDDFRATSRETTRMGWKEVEGHLEQGGPTAAVAEVVEDEVDEAVHRDQSQEKQ